MRFRGFSRRSGRIGLAVLTVLLPALSTTPASAVDRPLDDVVAVSADAVFHSCAIRTGGRLVCWGFNSDGQLGDGTTGTSLAAVPVPGMNDVKSVAVGGSHTCAVRITGATFCWGLNTMGQLGDGTTESRLSPVAVQGLPDAVSVSAGENFTCAVLVSGKVYCWGDNNYTQLGDGYTPAPNPVPVEVPGVTDAVSVNAGFEHACALTGGGTVYCWGRNDAGQLGRGSFGSWDGAGQVPGLSGIAALSTSYWHTCALATSGTVSCWGDGQLGQLGDGDDSWWHQEPSPVAVVGLSDARAIAAGHGHTCAVRVSGQAVCWGDNSSAALGDGTLIKRLQPTPVSGLTDAVTISAGQYHTCVIRESGQLVCWGHSWGGRLGDGSENEFRTSPVNVLRRVLTHSLAVVPGEPGQGRIVSDPAGLDCGETCTAEFDEGTTVTLTAIAAPGFIFTGWSGKDCPGTGTCSVGMDEARSVTAMFEPVPRGTHALITYRTGEGRGSVSSNPGDIDCGAECIASFEDGSAVTLTAVPAPGSVFTGWEGACSGTGPTCVVTMNRDKLVRAGFDLEAVVPEEPDTPEIPGEGVAEFNPATGRLAIRLKCPQRFRPRCLKMKARAVTGKHRKARLMSRTVTVRHRRAGAWKLARLRILPKFRRRVRNMAKTGRKALWVRIHVTARSGRRTTSVRRIHRRYRVRIVQRS